MSAADIATWAAVIVAGLSLVFSIYAWRRSADRRREAETDAELRDHDTRIAHLEGAMSHLPTSEQWVSMHRSIASTEEAVKGIGRSLDRVGSLVDQLVENEFQEGRAAKSRSG